LLSQYAAIIAVAERLLLALGSRVLVRRTVPLHTGPAGDARPNAPDSLADEYYPYDLVHDTPLASPGPADPAGVLATIGHKLRGHTDELRPRLASTEERRLLHLAQVSVVLELARTAHTADHEPIILLHHNSPW